MGQGRGWFAVLPTRAAPSELAVRCVKDKPHPFAGPRFTALHRRRKGSGGFVVRRRPLLSGDGVARKNPKDRKARVWDLESQSSYFLLWPQYCLVVD